MVMANAITRKWAPRIARERRRVAALEWYVYRKAFAKRHGLPFHEAPPMPESIYNKKADRPEPWY